MPTLQLSSSATSSKHRCVSVVRRPGSFRCASPFVSLVLTGRYDFRSLQPPTHPLSSNDRLLDEISKDVSRTQVNLNFFSKLALAPAAADEAPSSSTSSSATIPSHLRSALGRRIDRLSSTGRGPRDMSPTRSKALAANPPVSPSPSMRSDVTARPSDDRDGEPSTSTGGSPRTESLALPHIPELDFGTSSFSLSDSPAKGGRSESSVAAPPPAEAPAPAQELHSDGLTRILYIFSLIHPQLSYTQGYAELLAPLYWVYAGQGVSPDDAGDEHEGGHWAEPDAFWAFLALMGEVGEVVKGPGRRPWGEVDLTVGGRPELDIQWALSRLSARLKWADETVRPTTLLEAEEGANTLNVLTRAALERPEGQVARPCAALLRVPLGVHAALARHPRRSQAPRPLLAAPV
jgi:hypothetical protein